jgi:hypothetical protein
MSSMAMRAGIVQLLAAAVFALLPAVSVGQSPGPLSYRRVFVPEEALHHYIRGLLPLTREEFERRIELAAKKQDSVTAKTAVRVEQAVFRARLDGAALIKGESEIEIVAATNEPSLLSLDPCSLAIESADWKANDRRPAVIGRNPTGELQCLVEGSGTLRLRWNQAAAETAPGTSRFTLRLPIAPRRRLEITAPKEIELEVEGGLISQRDARTANSNDRMWLIDLTGAMETRLYARQAGAQQQVDGLVIVREETQYNVLPSVIDMKTSFTLDLLRQPAHQIKLEVDRGLQITAARIADQSMPFAAMTGEDDASQIVTLELPAEISGTDRVMEIAATARWSGDRAIELPRIIIAGGVLQESRWEVQAAPWLRLQARPVRSCVQTDASAATATRSTDRFVFQAFAADAAIEVAPNLTLAPLREESGTQLNVEATQVTGVLVADLRATGAGARFAVTAELPRQWLVDAVETQPADMFADRTLISGGQNPHRLQVKLARPLTAQQPLRLIIRGHFRRPPNNQQLGDEFFHMARFPEAHDRRQLIAVRVNDPAAELRLSGQEGVPRLDPAQLALADQRLFETPPGTVLVETGSFGQSVHASLQATTARYRADTSVRAHVARGRIEETVSIHCQPETSNVASVVVRVTPRPLGEVTWRLASEESREIPALMDDSPLTGVAAEDAIYRLLLPRPYSTPFEIIGQWSTHQSSRDDVSLVFLPAAIRQTGFVEVAAPDGDIFVRSQELQAVPSFGNERSTALCGRYRYEAGRRSKLSVEPLPSGIVQERTWIDALQLTSHYLVDGSGQHEAELKVKNAGGAELQMRLPATASEFHLVIEGEAEEPLDQVGTDNSVLIPLPADQREVTLRVRYVSKDRPLGIWPMGAIQAPVPRFDLPVLTQTWRVILPPELATATPSAELASSPIGDAEPHEALAAVATRSIRDRWNSIAGVLLGPALAARWMTDEKPSGSTGDPSFAGWSEDLLALPASDEATLAVYRPSVIAAWSYCLALAAGGLVFWLGGRGGWLLSIAGFLAAIAVISYAPAAWLLAGASSGIFFGQLLLFARPGTKSPLPVPSYQGSTTTRHYGIEPAAGLVAFLVVASSARLAAAPPGDSPQAHHDLPQVVIPMDKNQQPIGKYVYLDEALYEALHRLSGGEPSPLSAALFERAHYDLPVAATPRTGGAAVDELRAAFDFHTFHSDATVQLPLRRDQAHLLEGRARLDGRPATLSWNTDGRGLSFAVAESGKHRLEIAFATMAQQTPDSIALELDVPRVAIAGVTLPTSRISAGSIISDGANGNLDIRWPAPVAAQSAISLDADQLLLWKVRPGSVSLEGRFRLRPLGGPVRELIFEVDPRLRLLPGRTSGPISALKVQEGAIDLMKAELTEPISTPTELRIAWLWTDASGVGNLLLPRVQLKADRLSHDWTAISTEPELELTQVPASNSGVAVVTPAEFAQVWPDVGLGDSRIFAGAPKAGNWTVAIRPAASTPRAEQRTDWSVSSATSQAMYTAVLTEVPTSWYEHRLAMPAEVNVSRVNITQAGRAAAVRWKQEKDGLLIVSLLEPPNAEQTLTVIADSSLPRSQAKIPLPAIVLERATDGDSTLCVYRQSDVQLKVEAFDGWLPIDQEQIGKYKVALGRLTAAFRRQTATSAPPRVARASNQPQIAGRIFTRVDEDDGDWRGEVHLKLRVSGGMLDELRLSVPDEWSEPLEVQPAMEQRFEASQSESRRQLVIRGRQPLSGPTEITLRGPIHAGAGGLQAPDVFLVGTPTLERFVLLDRGSVAEQIDWEMTGLLAVRPTAVADSPPAWRTAGGDWFRVVGQRFDALAKAQPARAAAPRIALLEIRCAPRSGRRVLATAAMTIQPRGARDAEFVLPAGSRLVQAQVDGVPAPCVPQGLRSWKIPALSETLPYRLTIVYDTYLPSPTADIASLQVAAPVLLGMEVKQSLWTIEKDGAPRVFDGPKELHFAINDSVQASSLGAAELARLESIAHALDSVASAQAAELPRRILADGFLRWKGELTATQRRLNALLDQKRLTPDMTAQMQSTLDAAARAEQRLLLAGILSDSEVGETLRTQQRAEPAEATYYLVDGNPGELKISWTRSQGESMVARGTIALAILAAALLLAVALQLSAAGDLLRSHPASAWAVLGVAWWLLAPFGWLGWLAIIAALCGATRVLRTHSNYEAGSSTVHWSGSQSR